MNKKFLTGISVLTVLAFALLLVAVPSADAAGNKVNKNKADDSTWVQRTTSKSTLSIDNDSSACIFTNETVIVNSGANSAYAKDDMKNVTIGSGKTEVVTDEYLDVNSTDIVYTGMDGASNTNESNDNKFDDSDVKQVTDETVKEDVVNETSEMYMGTSNTIVNSGANSATADEDMNGVDITGGASSIDKTVERWFGYSRIRRK